jgi:hypothetical protein
MRLDRDLVDRQLGVEIISTVTLPLPLQCAYGTNQTGYLVPPDIIPLYSDDVEVPGDSDSREMTYRY